MFRRGIVALAVGQWLAANLQRPETDLTAWSADLEAELVAAVYAAAEPMLPPAGEAA